MGKKIRASLSAKVFLWIAALLILCSLLMYAIVSAAFPRSYQLVSASQISGELDELAASISSLKLQEAKQAVEAFCARNHVSATLSVSGETISFGHVEESSESSQNLETMGIALALEGKEADAMLTVTAPTSSPVDLGAAFLKLLPFILLAILAISALGAYLCSRILVRPILEISRISQRMARLDMTWSCPVRSQDEIGTLAESLNTMAAQLGKTMDSLSMANKKLQQDMEKITRLSRQQQDFFAAASHELKTPLTILKGQVESMLLGIGDYKNREKYLPRTLREIQHMEQLVGEILSITKIQTFGLPSPPEIFSLAALLEDCLEAVALLGREKQIAIVRQLSPRPNAAGNRSLLGKALQNVLDNSIRYSPAGATVTVTLTEEGMLTVDNTPASLPAKDPMELFAPFGRGEQSRNKKTGGSGLGLYLTKSILDLHGAPCGLTSRQNHVIFWTRLPEIKPKQNQNRTE